MAKKPDQTSLNILVVDDDEDIRVLLDKALGRLGHHVSLAKNAEQALNMLNRSYFHVVITDVHMGDMNGLELMEAIKEINATMQIYVITAHSDLEKVVQAMKKGASDFFEKPINLDDLRTSIQEASRRVNRWGNLYKRHASQFAQAATKEA